MDEDWQRSLQSLIEMEGEFYQGAYGPTLILIPRSLDAFTALVQTIRILADQPKREFDLLALPSVEIAGIASVVLRSRSLMANKAVRLKQRPEGGLALEWAQTPTEWERTAALLEGLLQGDQSGHQYLTREGIDEALVEVSFRERLKWAGHPTNPPSP